MSDLTDHYRDDAIAGRHVHLGRTIAVATCCADVAAQGEGNG